jgi:hypothetical protein
VRYAPLHEDDEVLQAADPADRDGTCRAPALAPTRSDRGVDCAPNSGGADGVRRRERFEDRARPAPGSQVGAALVAPLREDAARGSAGRGAFGSSAEVFPPKSGMRF